MVQLIKFQSNHDYFYMVSISNQCFLFDKYTASPVAVTAQCFEWSLGKKTTILF